MIQRIKMAMFIARGWIWGLLCTNQVKKDPPTLENPDKCHLKSKTESGPTKEIFIVALENQGLVSTQSQNKNISGY